MGLGSFLKNRTIKKIKKKYKENYRNTDERIFLLQEMFNCDKRAFEKEFKLALKSKNEEIQNAAINLILQSFPVASKGILYQDDMDLKFKEAVDCYSSIFSDCEKIFLESKSNELIEGSITLFSMVKPELALRYIDENIGKLDPETERKNTFGRSALIVTYALSTLSEYYPDICIEFLENFEHRNGGSIRHSVCPSNWGEYYGWILQNAKTNFQSKDKSV